MRGLATSTALALAATAFGLGTAGARAQDVPIVTDRVDVRLVEVDAWAQDGGRPVLDLAAEELRLFEDGRKVEILFFTPPARAESASPSGERVGRSDRVGVCSATSRTWPMTRQP